MNFNRRLYTGFGSVLIACLLLAGIANFSMKKTRAEYQHLVVEVAQLLNLAKESQLQLLEARSNEQGYIATRSPDILQDLQNNLVELKKINSQVRQYAQEAEQHQVLDTINSIETQLDSYNTHISELEKLILAQGDKDNGIRGNIRERAHEFEAIAQNAGSDTLLVEYLMMRRHEKDFLLREDPKYQGKMKDQLASLISKTRSDPLLDEQQRTEAIALAEGYQTGFEELSNNIIEVVRIRPATLATSENILSKTQLMVNSVSGWREELQANISQITRILDLILLVGSFIIVALVLIIAWYTQQSLKKFVKSNVGSISEGTQQIESASQQVSDSSQNLAQETSRQAASLETSSAAVHDMNKLTEENTVRTQKAAQLMSSTGQSVDHARNSMGQLMEAFSDISSTSEEISKIVKTIDEIAFQTNILALNAAVEAARAGEAGAGFAVVADEVRALAGRAAEAAQNTTRLIETTIDKIARGDSLAGETNTAFQEVDTSNNELGGLITEIANTAEDHQRAIASIRQSIDQVESGVQNNAAQSEETASAAQELNAQVNVMNDSLHHLARFFSVSEASSRAQTPSAHPTFHSHSTGTADFHSGQPNPPMKRIKDYSGQLISHGKDTDDDFTFFE